MTSQHKLYARGVLLFLFMSAACAFLAWISYANTFYYAHPWKVGDWLINYHGGFVRRGLPGEIFLGLSGGLNVSPLAPLYVVQNLCYALLFTNCFVLLARTGFDPFKCFLLVSPPALLFPILDLQGGYRKEILHFAVLSSFAVARSKRGRMVLASLWLPCLLAHELLFVMLPYYVYGLRKVGAPRIFQVGLSVAGAAIFFVVGLHKGDLEMAREMCSALLARGLAPTVCDGSIVSVATTFDQGLKQVRDALELRDYFGVYSVCGALSLLPLLAFGRRWRAHLDLASAFGLATLAVLPFTVVAVDWGRLIYMNVMSVSLFVVADVETHAANRGGRTLALSTAVWALTWGIPHCCSDYLRAGLVEMFWTWWNQGILL